MRELAFTIGQNGQNTYNVNYPTPLGFLDNISVFSGTGSLVNWAITLLFAVAVILTLIFILYGGLRWILSQGDKKGVEEARKTITYSIIGLLIVLLSFFIINFISFMFGWVPLLPN